MNEKIRIMHVAQAPGGVERYLQCLIKYLDHSKFENILVCSYDYKKEKFDRIVDSFEQIEIYRAIGSQDIRAIKILRKLIRKYNPDIVYAHSSKAGAVVRMANFGIKNICIYNPHGWAFNMQESKMKQMLYAGIERFMAPFCHKIVCISEAERKSALAKKICRTEKLQVIFNGIDVNAYDIHTDVPINDNHINIPEDAFVVGMAGRLCPQKAPDIFIQMAYQIKQQIPNAYFLIVGDGELHNKVLQYAEDHMMGNCVYITGWVDNPLDYIRLFDVAVLLSRWEGFGLVIPEYMICKKPIVATDVDAIPDIITDHINGLLVPVNDPMLATKAVIELQKNTSLRNQMVLQGSKDVYEKYDAKRMAKQHEFLFYSCLKIENKDYTAYLTNTTLK